jgi:hypothetical protein
MSILVHAFGLKESKFKFLYFFIVIFLPNRYLLYTEHFDVTVVLVFVFRTPDVQILIHRKATMRLFSCLLTFWLEKWQEMCDGSIQHTLN